HRRFRSRSNAGLEERARSAAEDWLGSAAAEDWPEPAAAADWPEPAADWLGPLAGGFPRRAWPERERWFASRRASSAPWRSRDQHRLHPSRTRIPRLCGQTTTESPHDYDRTAALTEGLALAQIPRAPRARATTPGRAAAPLFSAAGTLSGRGPKEPMEPGGGRRGAPRDEGGEPEALEHPPVRQRRAFRRDNGAAGRHQHRVAGGHVPFTRGREARIDVGGSFGELTEFHRRSARAPIGDRQSRQERLRLRFEMRAADHRNETRAWRRPGSNRAALLRCARRSSGRQTQPLGAAPLDPTPEDSLRRGGNDTETRTSTAHQRNIDRELIPPGDKLAGAVEGVDQDEAAGDALRERASNRLLRHHAHPGKHAGESFEDHRLGCVIGGGDRGEIGLGPDLERTRACRENGGCCGRDDGGEFVEQPAVHSDDVVVRSQARRLLMGRI